MKLYLLRHADAATQAEIDDERAISRKGRKQCGRVAEFCLSHDLKPEANPHEPTAPGATNRKPVARKLGIKIETVPWLVYETETGEVIRQLAARGDSESVMLVGHEPDLGLLAAALLGLERDAIRVRKASLLLLEISEFKVGGARLEWSLPVKMM